MREASRARVNTSRAALERSMDQTRTPTEFSNTSPELATRGGGSHHGVHGGGVLLVAVLSASFVAGLGCDWQAGPRTRSIGHGVWQMAVHEQDGEVWRLVIGRLPRVDAWGGGTCRGGAEYVRLGDYWYQAPPGDLVLIDSRTDRLMVVQSAPTQAMSEFFKGCRGSPEDVVRALLRLGKSLQDKRVVEFIDHLVSENGSNSQELGRLAPKYAVENID